LPINNPPNDHHFLPVFYLSRWQGAEGLVEFARRGSGKIEGRPCFPKSTGYQPGLYKNRFHSDPVSAQSLETDFMQILDRRAAESLALFEEGLKTIWTNEEASNWTRFILSLLQRTPEEVEQYKKSYSEFMQRLDARDEELYKAARWDGMPETLSEYIGQQRERTERGSLNLLRNLIGHPQLVQLINGMVWNTLETPDAEFEFSTSDRPVLMTSTLGEDNAYIVLPIGPHRLFAAAKDKITMKMLKNKNQTDLVKIINKQVVSHAVKYAYGSNHLQLRFVQNNLSTMNFEPLFTRLTRAMKKDHPRLR
jgi:hypothetical protein